MTSSISTTFCRQSNYLSSIGWHRLLMVFIMLCHFQCHVLIISASSNFSSSSSSSYSSTSTSPSSEGTSCPKKCTCSRASAILNCTEADLDRMPDLERSLTAVKKLILNGNQISFLGPNSFGPANHSSLQVLELRENNLVNISAGAFDSISGLRHLYLDSNRISSLPATLFRSTPQLQTLSLASNPIGGTGDSDWAFLGELGPSLKDLDVGATLVASVNPRLPPVFSSLRVLEVLTMRKLLNLNLTSEFFQPLADLDLQALDLSVGVIKSVDEDAFRPLNTLRDLDMSNVMVDSKTCANIFYGLANSSLEKVNLQGVFTYDEYPVLPDLFHHLKDSKLRELNFAGNYVGLRGRIPSRLFHPLKTLRKLHLDDCDLVNIHRDTFHGLHELKVGNITRCKR